MPPKFARRRLLGAPFFALVGSARAQAISKSAAIALAETFIAKNGYTSLPRDQINKDLDPESLEVFNDREQQLKLRFNTLIPRAIGIKKGVRGTTDGWSVSFDYVRGGPNSSTCRVVTMNDAGASITMQHVDGLRSNFAGFD